MYVRKLSLFFVAVAMLVSGCARYAPKETLIGDYLSGRLAARENDVDAAAAAFTGAQSEAPGAKQILRDAFFFQLAAGRVAGAMPLAEKLARDEESGDDGLSSVVLAARAIKNEQYAKARRYLDGGIDAGYLAAASIIIDVWALGGIEGPDAAYALLDQTTDENFRGFNPLHLGLLAEKAGRLDDARSAHQLSVMTYGGPIGRSAFGAFLERADDPTAARDFYELLEKDPGPDREIARRGLARIDAGAGNAAFSDTSPAEGAAIAFYSLGAAILEQTTNQRNAAERAGFNTGTPNYNLPLALTHIALYLDPNLDVALRFSGSIQNLYGKNEAAIEMLARIPRSSPYYELAQIEIARGLVDLDRTDDAIGVLRDVASQSEEAAEARLALSNLHASAGRHDDAIKILDVHIDALPADPDDDAWRFHIARAASLLETGDWERAELDLKRAVEIAPEQPAALNYLGYSWAERGVHLEEAFELIEKAVSLQPNSGAIIDSLGWARYQLGDYDEAVGHLEQAASIEPGDPTITDHLGDVYWRLGRNIEARYQWRRVLELAPGDELETSIENKMAVGLPNVANDRTE